MNENFYIDDGEFRQELRKWRDSAERPEDRMPSERLGQMLITLHEHVLRHKNFCRYRQDLKDEMLSYSVYRILKRGLFTYDPAKSSPFSYFTRAAFSNFIIVLKRYYNSLNRKQAWIKGELAKINTNGDPKLEWLVEHFEISG